MWENESLKNQTFDYSDSSLMKMIVNIFLVLLYGQFSYKELLKQKVNSWRRVIICAIAKEIDRCNNFISWILRLYRDIDSFK